MIRTKGEAGTGDVVNAVTHMRAVFGGIRRLGSLREEELYAEAKELRAPYELVKWVAVTLPVVTFTAGGIATRGRRALHAARRGRRLRRLRHLQVRRPRAPRRRSSRRRRTSATRTSSPASPRAWASRWSASRRPRSSRASCSRRAAGSSAARRADRLPGSGFCPRRTAAGLVRILVPRLHGRLHGPGLARRPPRDAARRPRRRDRVCRALRRLRPARAALRQPTLHPH